MFYGFSRLEVSRVIPIAHTYPVFVAIMASIFLGENLSAFQWGAIFITVGGAGLITTSPGQQTTSTSKAFVYLLVLLGSVLNAIANVTYKYALDGIEFWDLFANSSEILKWRCVKEGRGIIYCADETVRGVTQDEP